MLVQLRYVMICD